MTCWRDQQQQSCPTVESKPGWIYLVLNQAGLQVGLTGVWKQRRQGDQAAASGSSLPPPTRTRRCPGGRREPWPPLLHPQLGPISLPSIPHILYRGP